MAQDFLIGGVNSPIRSFAQVGGEMLNIARGRGAYVFDLQGKKYLDFAQGFGPMILGHGNYALRRAMKMAEKRGVIFGFTNPKENLLAKKIAEAIPMIEKIRFTTSGSEATMSAVNLAKFITKRKKVLTFEGGYHGHALAQTSTLATPWNDLESLKKVLAEHNEEIACLIAEPILGNAGLILPEKDFWPAVAQLLKEQKILFIMDEVLTGFRVRFGATYELFNIQPDLIVLGKIIGGGLPIGAFGGREELMQHIRPVGDFPHAGTFAGHPLSCSAGISTLEILEKKFDELIQKTAWFEAEMKKILPAKGVQFYSIGTLFGFFFSQQPVKNFKDAQKSDQECFKQFFWHLVCRGFLLPPSPLEADFLSVAQSKKDLKRFLKAVGDFLNCLNH